MRCDFSAGSRLRMSAVGAGELAFLDWVAPSLVFLRAVTTKVDSKVRSLEEPVCFFSARLFALRSRSRSLRS